MTDLEMTKKCAEAMGYEIDKEMSKDSTRAIQTYAMWNAYDPLGNDAQALALMKHLRLHINSFHGAALLPRERWWEVEHNDGEQATISKNADLNRAIVECVAKLAAKQ